MKNLWRFLFTKNPKKSLKKIVKTVDFKIVVW